MPDRNQFKKLNESGEKTVKFHQRKELPKLTATDKKVNSAKGRFSQRQVEILSEGACFGLTYEWMREKLQGTNSNILGSARNFVRDPTPRTNKAATNAGAHLQLQLEKGKTSVDNWMVSNAIDRQKWPEPQERNLDPADFGPSFEQACHDMEKRTGATMGVTFHNPVENRSEAHIVGLYKSKGDHLYFFDPNYGGHQVNDPAAFIRSWTQANTKDNTVVVMGGPHGSPDDGFTKCTLNHNLRAPGGTPFQTAP
jgi:hypothetical protein